MIMNVLGLRLGYPGLWAMHMVLLKLYELITGVDCRGYLIRNHALIILT